MSPQKDLLREIAAATNSDAPDRISDWFTEDFRLYEPGQPPLPMGHEGARQMREQGRRIRAELKREGLTTPVKLEILDMIEESDRVAVRWQVTGTYDNGKPYGEAIMSIYRFVNGRIAEDWGMAVPVAWP